DLDGDGDLDLMVASSGFALDVDPTMPGAAGLPVELLMIEDGKVIAVESVVPFLHGASLRAAVVSDTDHDGQAELLLFSDGHDLPNALMVRGESGWTDVAPERFFDLRFHGVGAASADLNDDGRLDWCVSDLGPPQCFLSFGEDEWTLAGEAQGLVDDTLPPMPGAPGMLGRGLSF
ncbi:MAG: hypothetical protein GY884_08070, partial [Proteobacteria bacterium]|nr:hypothetical protein [Pseudomonadota bacterium]